MTIACRGLKVKVKVMGQTNTVGPTSIEGSFSSWFCSKCTNADVFQVNEAFAAQFLSVQKILGLDLDKTNMNGGAVAVGHPIGASGSRIIANLTHEIV